MDGRGISGPGGFIPSELVSKWTVGTDSSYHGGKGVAGGLGGATAGAIGGGLLLGPIGLLGLPLMPAADMAVDPVVAEQFALLQANRDRQQAIAALDADDLETAEQ